MSVIHFPENYKKTLMQGFAKASETDGLFTHELDIEFSGVNTVHVTTVKTTPLQQYNRGIEFGTSSRYGKTVEVGDEVQTFTMTQEPSLSLSIDKANNADQFNMKKAGNVMKAYRDEQIIPTMDTYRLRKWAQDGGIHKELSEAPSKTNIVTQIIELHNEMLDAGVPDQITLVIARSYLPSLKLSSEWTALDSLGGKSLPKGSIGEFDGMAVKPTTTKRMPAKVPFMLIYKGSVISPMKINTLKGHVDPPGMNGDLLEFKMYYDAFVIGKKANGVAVAVLKGFVTAAPTISVSGGKATITGASGATVMYTTDGSDPRYSKDAKVYTAEISVASGDVVRAYATSADKYASAVVEKTV